MRQFTALTFCFLCGLSFSACSDNHNVIAESESEVPTKIVISTGALQPIAAEQEQEPKKQSAAGGLLDFANKVLEKVDEKSDDAKKAKEWMNDKFGESSGGEPLIPEDAAKWAADAFKSLKEKGMTTAGSPAQWLQEDIRNMNALKYKIVKVSLDDIDGLEEELNKMGQLRWDCFHVTEKNGETILFFKKERRSILKNIPVRDMMKLVPLMGGE